MLVCKWPVDEEAVDVVQPQVAKALCAAEQHIALYVHVVPHLRGDKELLALERHP